MRYPVAIETGTKEAAFGVVVPDLPGCFSAGDTIEEAMANVEEAIGLWIDAALDADTAIPHPSPLDAVRQDPKFAGWALAFAWLDPAALDDTVERVNITIPRRVLYRLDQRAKAAGESRSGYIAKLALS